MILDFWTDRHCQIVQNQIRLHLEEHLHFSMERLLCDYIQTFRLCENLGKLRFVSVAELAHHGNISVQK